MKVRVPIVIGKQLPAIEYADTNYNGYVYNGFANSDLKENKIIISKPVTTPNFIEARGIGLIEVPFVVSAKLFCFVKITNLELKRLPNAKEKHCFGKKFPKNGFPKFFLRISPGLPCSSISLAFMILSLRKVIKSNREILSGTWRQVKGNLLTKINQNKSAIQCYKKAIFYNQTYIQAYTNLSSCYEILGFFDEAIHFANEAIKINPNQSKKKLKYFNLKKDI